MEEAIRFGDEHPRYSAFLERALDHLYRAHGQCADASERAVVEWRLSLSWLSVGDLDSSQYWANWYRHTAEVALEELIVSTEKDTKARAKKFYDGRDGRAIPSSLSTFIESRAYNPDGEWVMAVPLFGILAYRFIKRLMRGNRAPRINALHDFVHFYNASQLTMASILDTSPSDYLVIKDQYRLRSRAEPSWMLRTSPPLDDVCRICTPHPPLTLIYKRLRLQVDTPPWDHPELFEN